MARIHCLALVLLVLCSTAHAQKARKGEVQRELIGWQHLRAIEFASPSWRYGKPAGKRLATVTAELEKQRTKVAKETIGREFYGLCEIVKIRPYRSKVRTLEFILWERKTLDRPSKIGSADWDNGDAYLMQLKVIVPMEEARRYSVGDAFNLSGKVTRFQFDDWHNVIMGGEGYNPIITVTIDGAEF